MSCLEITTKIGCIPNMCNYCPQVLLMQKYKHITSDRYMSLDTFKTCVNKVPKHIEISFSGYAECFLNPDCSMMILHAYNQGYKVNLYSTLMGMTIQDVEDIKDIKFNHISIHLPDRDHIMKVEVDEHYLRVAQRFNGKFPRNHAHVYGNPHPELQKIFNDIRIMHYDSNDLHSRANTLNITEIKQKEKLKGKIRCGARYREGTDIIDINVLLPNGDVQLCCMAYNLQHKLGNLLTDSYEDLFNSEGYKEVIRGLDDENSNILCRTCKEAVQI